MGDSPQGGLADLWLWLSAHPPILLLVLAAVGWVMRALNRTPEAHAQRPESEAEEAAERTRRGQEQVRRLIEARRSKSVPRTVPSSPTYRPVASPTVAPRPVAFPVEGQRSWGSVAEAAADAEAGAADADREAREEKAAAAASRIAALAGEARALEGLAAVRSGTTLGQPISGGIGDLNSGSKGEGGPSAMAAELRGAGNLRRAIVWREILGPPVGLR